MSEKRFVILSTQRSGSNWLEDRLDSHPDINMKRGEIFRKTLKSEDAYFVRARRDTKSRTLSTVAPAMSKALFLAEIARETDERAVGFRLMYDQLRRSPSLLASLRVHHFLIIHLIRENLLETHISIARAKASDLFITRSEDKRPERIELPTTDLVEALERRALLIERHRRIAGAFPSLELTYEQCLSSPAIADRRLLGFIGVSEFPDLESSFVRLSSPTLADKITNADQVAKALRHTRFAHMVDELS